MRYFFLFICCLFTSILLANVDVRFEEGNTAYQAKDYATAVAKYEAVVQEGYQSSELYYNLANSYYRNQQIGKAILFYERTLLLKPNHKDAAFNLGLANQIQKDEIDELPPFFLKAWWQGLHHFFSSTIWSILAILLLWIAIAGVCFWIIGNDRNRRKQGFILALSGSLLTLLFFLLASSQAAYEQDTGKAIITQKEVALLNAPDATSPTIIAIHEGLKVEILDEIGEWYKLRLPNGEEGWMKKTEVEKI